MTERAPFRRIARFFHRPVRRFLALMLAGVFLQAGMLLCLRTAGDAGLALYAALFHGALPLLSALLPYWAGKGGVHPMAAFFPISGPALLFPSPAPWLPWVCLVFSLVASVAGQETRKRKETEIKKSDVRKAK